MPDMDHDGRQVRDLYCGGEETSVDFIWIDKDDGHDLKHVQEDAVEAANDINVNHPDISGENPADATNIATWAYKWKGSEEDFKEKVYETCLKTGGIPEQ